MGTNRSGSWPGFRTPTLPRGIPTAGAVLGVVVGVTFVGLLSGWSKEDSLSSARAQAQEVQQIEIQPSVVPRAEAPYTSPRPAAPRSENPYGGHPAQGTWYPGADTPVNQEQLDEDSFYDDPYLF